MKIRACLFGLMAVVSLTSGCACCDSPCWGFRLHPWSSPCGSPCGGCCPAYSSPVSAPVVYRSPAVSMNGPDCPCNGTPVINHPAAYPGSGYPATYPIIGNPTPLPGVGPKDTVPNTMPGKN
jgi:hypothetical protein